MEFVGKFARKRGDSSLLRVEAEKTKRAGRIGAESGLFRVPEVLQFDPDTGVLDCEYIPDLITFGAMVARGFPETEAISHQTGRALARVHRDLKLDDEMLVDLPDPWRVETEAAVFIHGDLTEANVCFDQDSRNLVIVDWMASPLPIVGGLATRGVPCFDILWFVRQLFVAPPWRRTWNWPAARLSDLFLRGYIEDLGRPLDATVWHQLWVENGRVGKNSMQQRIQNAPWPKRLPKAVMQRHRYAAWRHYEPPQGILSR